LVNKNTNDIKRGYEKAGRYLRTLSSANVII